MGKTEIKGFKDIPQVEKVLAEKELGKYIEKFNLAGLTSELATTLKRI